MYVQRLTCAQSNILLHLETASLSKIYYKLTRIDLLKGIQTLNYNNILLTFVNNIRDST